MHHLAERVAVTNKLLADDVDAALADLQRQVSARDDMLRQQDTDMGVLFDRLSAAGADRAGDRGKGRVSDNKITLTGKYTTRDGRPVRVLCVDAKGPRPVVALVMDGGNEVTRTYSEVGERDSEHPRCAIDLILRHVR